MYFPVSATLIEFLILAIVEKMILTVTILVKPLN